MTDEFSCKLCSAQFSSRLEEQEHEWTLSHHKRMEKDRHCSHVCSLCTVEFANLLLYTQHISTERHRMRVQENRRKCHSASTITPVTLVSTTTTTTLPSSSTSLQQPSALAKTPNPYLSRPGRMGIVTRSENALLTLSKKSAAIPLPFPSRTIPNKRRVSMTFDDAPTLVFPSSHSPTTPTGITQETETVSHRVTTKLPPRFNETKIPYTSPLTTINSMSQPSFKAAPSMLAFSNGGGTHLNIMPVTVSSADDTSAAASTNSPPASTRSNAFPVGSSQMPSLSDMGKSAAHSSNVAAVTCEAKDPVTSIETPVLSVASPPLLSTALTTTTLQHSPVSMATCSSTGQSCTGSISHPQTATSAAVSGQAHQLCTAVLPSNPLKQHVEPHLPTSVCHSSIVTTSPPSTHSLVLSPSSATGKAHPLTLPLSAALPIQTNLSGVFVHSGCMESVVPKSAAGRPNNPDSPVATAVHGERDLVDKGNNERLLGGAIPRSSSPPFAVPVSDSNSSALQSKQKWRKQAGLISRGENQALTRKPLGSTQSRHAGGLKLLLPKSPLKMETSASKDQVVRLLLSVVHNVSNLVPQPDTQCSHSPLAHSSPGITVTSCANKATCSLAGASCHATMSTAPTKDSKICTNTVSSSLKDSEPVIVIDDDDDDDTSQSGPVSNFASQTKDQSLLEVSNQASSGICYNLILPQEQTLTQQYAATPDTSQNPCTAVEKALLQAAGNGGKLTLQAVGLDQKLPLQTARGGGKLPLQAAGDGGKLSLQEDEIGGKLPLQTSGIGGKLYLQAARNGEKSSLQAAGNDEKMPSHGTGNGGKLPPQVSRIGRKLPLQASGNSVKLPLQVSGIGAKLPLQAGGNGRMHPLQAPGVPSWMQKLFDSNIRQELCRKTGLAPNQFFLQSVKTAAPQISVSTTVPHLGVPTNAPQISVSATVPQLGVPTNAPQISVSATVPHLSVPTNAPQIVVLTTTPQTGVSPLEELSMQLGRKRLKASMIHPVTQNLTTERLVQGILDDVNILQELKSLEKESRTKLLGSVHADLALQDDKGSSSVSDAERPHRKDSDGEGSQNQGPGDKRDNLHLEGEVPHDKGEAPYLRGEIWHGKEQSLLSDTAQFSGGVGDQNVSMVTCDLGTDADGRKKTLPVDKLFLIDEGSAPSLKSDATPLPSAQLLLPSSALAVSTPLILTSSSALPSYPAIPSLPSSQVSPPSQLSLQQALPSQASPPQLSPLQLPPSQVSPPQLLSQQPSTSHASPPKGSSHSPQQCTSPLMIVSPSSPQQPLPSKLSHPLLVPASPPQFTPASPPQLTPESPPLLIPASPPLLVPASPPLLVPASPPLLTPASLPLLAPASPPQPPPQPPPVPTSSSPPVQQSPLGPSSPCQQPSSPPPVHTPASVLASSALPKAELAEDGDISVSPTSIHLSPVPSPEQMSPRAECIFVLKSGKKCRNSSVAHGKRLCSEHQSISDELKECVVGLSPQKHSQRGNPSGNNDNNVLTPTLPLSLKEEPPSSPEAAVCNSSVIGAGRNGAGDSVDLQSQIKSLNRQEQEVQELSMQSACRLSEISTEISWLESRLAILRSEEQGVRQHLEQLAHQCRDILKQKKSLYSNMFLFPDVKSEQSFPSSSFSAKDAAQNFVPSHLKNPVPSCSVEEPLHSSAKKPLPMDWQAGGSREYESLHHPKEKSVSPPRSKKFLFKKFLDSDITSDNEEEDSSSSCARTRSLSAEPPKKRFKKTPEILAAANEENKSNNSSTHACSLLTEPPKKKVKKSTDLVTPLSPPLSPATPGKPHGKLVPGKFSMTMFVKKESKIGEHQQQKQSIHQSDSDSKTVTLKERDSSGMVAMDTTAGGGNSKTDKVSLTTTISAPCGAHIGHSPVKKFKIKCKKAQKHSRDFFSPENEVSKPCISGASVGEKALKKIPPLSAPSQLDKKSTAKASKSDEDGLKRGSSSHAPQDKNVNRSKGVKENATRGVSFASGTVEAIVDSAITEGHAMKEEMPRKSSSLYSQCRERQRHRTVDRTLPADSRKYNRSYSEDDSYDIPTKRQRLQSPPTSGNHGTSTDFRRDDKEVSSKSSCGFRKRSQSLSAAEVQSKPSSGGESSHNKKHDEHNVLSVPSFPSGQKESSRVPARGNNHELLRTGADLNTAPKKSQEKTSSPELAQSMADDSGSRITTFKREGATSKGSLEGTSSRTPASMERHAATHKKTQAHAASHQRSKPYIKTDQHSGKSPEPSIQAPKQSEARVHKQSEIHAHKHSETHAHKHSETHAHRQSEKLSHKQSETHSHKQSEIHQSETHVHKQSETHASANRQLVPKTDPYTQSEPHNCIVHRQSGCHDSTKKQSESHAPINKQSASYASDRQPELHSAQRQLGTGASTSNKTAFRGSKPPGGVASVNRQSQTQASTYPPQSGSHSAGCSSADQPTSKAVSQQIAEISSSSQQTSPITGPSSLSSQPFLVLPKFEGHRNAVLSMKVFGKELYTCSSDKTVQVYNTHNGKLVKTFCEHQKSVTCLEVYQSRNGTLFLLSGSGDKFVNMYNMNTGKLFACFKCSTRVMYLSVTANMLFVAQNSGTMAVIDLEEKKLIGKHMCHPEDKALSCLVTNSQMLCTASFDSTVACWDIRDLGSTKNLSCMTLLQTLKSFDNTVLCMKIKNKLLYCGSADKTLQVFNTRTFERVKIITCHKGPLSGLEIMGGVLVTVCFDKLVRCFDLEKLDLLQVYGGHSELIFSVVTQNGVIYTGAKDGSIQANVLDLTVFHKCKWHSCDLRFGIFSHLLDHLTVHCPESKTDSESVCCRWRQCNFETRPDKLLTHLKEDHCHQNST